MKSNLDLFRAQLDINHAKVTALWKARHRKAVMVSAVSFMCFVTFVCLYFFLESERAAYVALILAAVCIAQGWVLTREEHDWSVSLADAGRCNSYVSLLNRYTGKTQAFEIRHRPIYMADYLALQDFVDSLEDGSFDRSEKAAAMWLEQGMPSLAVARQG